MFKKTLSNYTEVAEKLGHSVVPNYSVSSTSTTKWTSRRAVVAYSGVLYELQIIEGEPTSSSSPLRANYTNIDYSAGGFQAGASNILEVLSATAMSKIPHIGGIISAGLTILDLYGAVADSMTTNTTIDQVLGTAVISLSSHMKYIFVKKKDTSDIGNQILCYAGSAVSYTLTLVSIIDYYNGNELITYHDTEENITGTAESAYYTSGSYNLCAKNYHDYKNYNIDFSEYYVLMDIELAIFNRTRSFDVPYEYPPLS